MNSPYLTTTQAAEYLHTPKNTLNYFRVTGGGPKFCKLGRRVVYRKVDLDTWAESKLRASTSE